MADDALTLIREAAGHELLGQDALLDATLSGGGTTTLYSCPELITWTNDARWRQAHLLFWAYSQADQQRRVYSRNGAFGQVQALQPLAAAPAAGAPVLFFRDFSYSEWLDILNSTVRALHYDSVVYQRGISDLYQYSLPTPLSQGGWIREVFRGEYPTRWTDPQPPGVEWYRLNPLNVVGDIALVLEETLDADEQLVFHATVPFWHGATSAYTMTRSVLTPFGQTDAVSVPRSWLVAGMVWRALVRKTRTLSGAARAQWQANTEEAARRYAEQCAAHGVTRVGKRELGFSDRG